MYVIYSVNDIYSAPLGVRSIMINLSVCVCVCLSMSISLELLDRSSRYYVCRSPVAIARSSSSVGIALGYVLLVFMDDIMFGRNGRDAEMWRLHHAATAMSGVAIPGQSLMSVKACLYFSCS